jgi:hypothetical protein
VDSYIAASDAFVALCTEDDRVPGNTAQNIIDEIGRARAHPKLSDVVCVLKERQVNLPSNINPVWESLDRSRPDIAFDLIRRQLNAWGVVPTTARIAPAPPAPLPPEFLEQLFTGTRLGEHEKADARVRQLFGLLAKRDQRRVAQAVFEHLMAAHEASDEIHVSASFLEAIGRLDPALVPMEWIEQLVASGVIEHRMSATMMLWDLAETAPGVVPIDLIIKLAKPATEDWYVFSPAMAAAKQLALTRQSGLQVLLDLGRSTVAEDRYAAVGALTDLADVNAALIPVGPVRRLTKDADKNVSDPARKLLAVISKVKDEERGTAFRTFGI